MAGSKKDQGKNRLDLWPPDAFLAIGRVLTFGSTKYADRNWERGMAWGRVYAALQRHLNAWWGGEPKDIESGYSHLWHAGSCLVFLISYELRGVGKDDRPRRSPTTTRPKASSSAAGTVRISPRAK